MKVVRGLFTAIIVLLGAISLQGQILFHPQIGGNYDAISEEFAGYDSEGVQLGIVAGCDLRIPESKFFFNPGFFYSNTQSNLITEIKEEEEILEISRVKLPVRLGYYFSDVDNLVRFRMNVGVQGSWLMEIKSDEDTFNEDDFNDTLLDATAGIGVDIIWLTFDLNYTYGLSPFLKVNDSHSNVVTATVGLALNPRDFR